MIFGGFCWKIVRTTETGGVKLIYNGKPKGDGSCSNTGDNSQLAQTSLYKEEAFETTEFGYHDTVGSIGDVGYMYGNNYEWEPHVINVYDLVNQTNIVYGNDVIYQDGVYTLKDQYVSVNGIQNDYETIANKYHYTCASTDSKCEKVFYINVLYNVSSTYAQFEAITLTNGVNIEQAITEMSTGGKNLYDSDLKKVWIVGINQICYLMIIW